MRILIRIQSQIQSFDDRKFLKIYCNFLVPRPPESTPKIQEKPSTLKREKIQHLKNENF
jgi:hypothetical protein